MEKLPRKPKREFGPNEERPLESHHHNIVDVLSLPDGERQVIQYLLRVGSADLEEIASYCGQTEGEVRILLDELTEKGFLQAYSEAGQMLWRTKLVQKQHKPSSLWNQLDNPPG